MLGYREVFQVQNLFYLIQKIQLNYLQPLRFQILHTNYIVQTLVILLIKMVNH